MSRVSTTLAEIRQLALGHRQIVPASYLDENDHVNVQFYVHLADLGLTAFFARMGLGEVYEAADEYGTFALEQHIRYLAEIRVDEQISVYVRLLELTPKRAYLMGFLVNDSREQLAATVEVVQMNIAMAERRGASYPPAALATLESTLAQHQRLPWTAPVCSVMRA